MRFIHLLVAAGLAAFFYPVAAQTYCASPTKSVTSVGVTASPVPAAPLPKRTSIAVCNSSENSGTAIVKCREDGTNPTLGATYLGDTLAKGQCITYAIGSGTSVRCIADSPGTAVAASECIGATAPMPNAAPAGAISLGDVSIGSVTTTPPFVDPDGNVTTAKVDSAKRQVVVFDPSLGYTVLLGGVYIDGANKLHVITDPTSVTNATLQAGSAVIGKVQLDPNVVNTVNVSGLVSGGLTNAELRATPVPVSGTFTVTTTPSFDVDGSPSTVSASLAGGKRAAHVVMVNPTTGAAIDPDATVTIASTSDFDGTFTTSTSGLSTATTLTQLVPASGTSRIVVKNWKCSAGVASTAATADERCTLKVGTGTNCGTNTVFLDACFQPLNGGCNGGEVVVPSGNALCWIHAVAGSKVVTATYRYAP